MSKYLKNEKGVSLVIVLWMVLFFMVIIGEFAITMRAEGRAAANYKDEVLAYNLALSGLNMGIAEVSGKYSIVALDKEGAVIFIKKDSNGFRELKRRRQFELGEGKVSYAVDDETSRLNLNTADRNQLDNLLASSGVERAQRDVILDSVEDWADENSFYRMNGAEDEYYESLPSPYGSKDGPFDAVEELLLVKGLSPAIFYGTANVPQGQAAPSPAEGEFNGLKDHLTVYGSGKLNINTASPTVLEAVLGKGMAGEVMLRRATSGYFDAPAYGGMATSAFFTLRAVGEVRGIRVGVRAVVERKGAACTIRYWRDEGIV